MGLFQEMMQDLFKSAAQRKSEQDKARNRAILKAKIALRKEQRNLKKSEMKIEGFRSQAVEWEKKGRTLQAKQTVRQMVQLDKEIAARGLALGNMAYAIEQVELKRNYAEFTEGMQVVANIEEIAQNCFDPVEVQERLKQIADENRDVIEPWTEVLDTGDGAFNTGELMNSEEKAAYERIKMDAVGSIESESAKFNTDITNIDAELDQKMQEITAKE
jgi:hypothetical protein